MFWPYYMTPCPCVNFQIFSEGHKVLKKSPNSYYENVKKFGRLFSNFVAFTIYLNFTVIWTMTAFKIQKSWSLWGWHFQGGIIFEQYNLKKRQTSSSSDTFSPKFRMLSSFSASRSLTFISSSCRQLIISSFCRMMSALYEEGWQSSWSKPDCLVVSTISESFRIRSLAVSSSPFLK